MVTKDSRILALVVVALTLSTFAAPATAQPSFSKSFEPNEMGPGSVSTISFLITNGSASPVTGLAFTDLLPAGVTIADPARASTTCDLEGGGTLDAPDGGTTITLTDARVEGASSCLVAVDVTSTTPGMHTNPAITLSSSAGSSMSSAVDLTVDDQRPGFLKSFSPSSVPFGGRSTLTFTFDNTANADPVVFLLFTDTLPDGTVVADPTNFSTDCGQLSFNFSLAPGGSMVSLTAQGASSPGFEVVTAGGSCTISFDVVATSAAVFDNVTSDLSSRSGTSFSNVSSGKASARLEATSSALALTKAFVDDPVPPGDEATLELTIFNFDRSFQATGVGLTDDLGATLTDLTFTSIDSNDCGGMVLGMGTTTLQLTGGTVAPEGFCTLRVHLAVPPGATPGQYVNTTGAVSATVDGSPVVGNMASDTLFVEPVPRLTKEFTDDPVNAGETVNLEFTVTNTSTTSNATDIAFTDFFPEVIHTASVTPGNGCCGGGSTCTFSPVVIPPPPASVTPARLVISGGTLAPAGMAGDSCTFAITLDVLESSAPGFYENITTEITATVDGATRTGDPATDILTVVGAPRLTKSFTDDPVTPGDSVTLEFTLTHPADAPGAATGITFTDDLAPVLTGLVANLPSSPDPPCGAGSTLTGSAGDTLLTMMNGSLLPGESCTFAVTLDVPAAAAAGSYANTTSGVSATVAGVASTSAPASDDLTVTGLHLTKEFLGDPVLPGEMVTLRFTLENLDPINDASSITFNDDLSQVLPGTPDLGVVTSLPISACGGNLSLIGSTLLFFSGGALLQGDPPCFFDVVLQVPVGVADGEFSNSTSNLQAVIDGSAVVLDPAADFLTIESDLLQLTKEFVDDPVMPGDSVTLRFVLTNLDGARSASSIAFTDDLFATLPGLAVATSSPFAACGGTVDTIPDAGNIDFSGGSLPPAGSCLFDVTLDVPMDAADGEHLNTTSEVTGLIDGLPVTGGPASDNLRVFELLSFSKSFDGPTVAGGSATLSFTITNPRASSAGPLAFFDDLNTVVPGLVATNLPLNDVCGEGSALAGASLVTLTGASLPPAGGTCAFDVEVLVPSEAAPGAFPNTTSELFESGLLAADPAMDDLVIEPPPLFDKGFVPDAVGLGFSSTVALTIDNTASALAATDLDFTDNLPAGMLVAMPANASTTCTGGTLTATAGTAIVAYTGGSVGAGASCTVQADVVTVATGFLVNTTGDLTSSSGNSGQAQATLAVDPQPGFHKSFSPNKIAVGGLSTLTFTIDNTFATVAATSLDFTDNLPADVVIATPSSASTDCTGGTLTAADGGSVVTYTGGSVGAGASCTVQVDVTSSVVGTHTNQTGDLTSSLGNSGDASADLRVNPPPLFSKAFAPDPTFIGGVVVLTFTVDNTASNASATGLGFTDNLPTGLEVADPANTMTDCSGGTLNATPGTTTISYSGGTVSASLICTLSVDVTPTAAGDYTNTTGALTSSLGDSGSAEATLRVDPPPVFSKAFAPTQINLGGVATLTFAINNTASTASATGLDFLDNMPMEIVVADPSNATTDCDGGILTADPGTSAISYTGGIVAAMAQCTVSVDVTSDVLGTHDNLTGELTSSLGTSGTAAASLDVADLQPPAVTAVTAGGDPLAECSTVRVLFASLGVVVEDGETPIVGADDPMSYLLVEVGPDGDFNTSDCSAVAGDDVEVPILGTSVGGADPLVAEVSVQVADGNGLAGGLYRFFVCDTITDGGMNALDGGDFSVPFFRADPGNRFVNAHFDDCPASLDSWMVTEAAPNVVLTGVPGTDDYAESPLSASVRFVQSDFPETGISQCVDVAPERVFDFGCQLRFEPVMGALAVFEKSCQFFDAPACGGSSLGEAAFAALLEDDGGIWISNGTEISTPTGATSALCVFAASPLGSDPLYDFSLDGLFLTDLGAAAIFTDGFESGDTTAWSAALP